MLNNITFRKLNINDIKTMHKWLNKEFVHKWFYNDIDLTYDEVSQKYIPYINGVKPIHAFIIVFNNHDIGYIQTYKLDDYPDYAKAVDVNFDAAGMDLFIGEKEYLYKGYGEHIMKLFLAQYVFLLNKVSYCVIGPEPNNKSAIRAYEKTGFKYLKTIQLEDEPEPEYLMFIDKGMEY